MIALTLILLGSVRVCNYDLDNPNLTLPHKLEVAVGFWQDVYTKYDSNTVIVHDRDNLALVWAILSVPNTKAGEEQIKHYTDRLAQRLRHPDRIRTQRGLSDRFQSALERYRQLRPSIQQQLRDHGVIEELAALPFVESMFNVKAASSVGAAGMWQLMPDVARSLGLRTRKPDQRLDPDRATEAAARVLRHNYDKLGSWDLAITAYNHGLGGMQRAKAKCGSSLDVVLGCYESPSFGFASQNFYAEFLAAWDLVRDM
jgi:membrane-bound lytic murein transglycosylase D